MTVPKQGIVDLSVEHFFRNQESMCMHNLHVTCGKKHIYGSFFHTDFSKKLKNCVVLLFLRML